jgi:hypothetical protein
MQLLIRGLLQIDLERIEEEYFVANVCVVERRGHQMQIQMLSHALDAIELSIANLAHDKE